MSDFEIDLTQTVSYELLRQTIAGYNSAYAEQFSLRKNGDSYTLAEGDEDSQDIHVTGTLREVACYWEGRVSGQLNGQPDDEEGI